jgi:natural product biosynthesis luciferase-like monooxygenase protein
MEFGLMFFSGSDRPAGRDRYALVREASRFADRAGFCAVWTPERHFDEFGGLFPNPSVLSAAIAMITDRIQIRAGSLISPLHDPIRIAEEWSVVDNLSNGRVAISFGSGWNADDFVFHPEHYAERQARLYQDIDEVTRLWRGGTIARRNGAGAAVDVRVRPRPLQADLPLWITSSGHVETFVSAGRLGANVLTHLIGQTIDQLAEKIRRYREARAAAGFDASSGIVSVMLHTFIGPSFDEVVRIVKAPMCAYLQTAVRLEQRAAAGGGAISGGHRVEPHAIEEESMQDLIERTFQRYVRTASLLGTIETGKAMVAQLAERGVNEIACLVDFGPTDEQVMASLTHLDALRRACSDDATAAAAAEAALISDFTASLH